jgi:hypothetical protein
MALALFQVRTDDVDQVVSGLPLLGLRPGAAECVIADVACEHLGHEAVHGAARGGDQAQHVAALRFVVERACERVDLTANPCNAMRKFFFWRIV